MENPTDYKLVPTELLRRIVARDDSIACDDDHYALPYDIREALDEILAGPSTDPKQ